MSAPTRVQDSGVVSAGSVTSIDLPLTGVANGNMIVVLANDFLGNRTFTFSDFSSNTYHVDEHIVSAATTGDYIANAHTDSGDVNPLAGWSGTHNVTVTGSVPGNCSISGIAIEVTGQATSPFNVGDTHEETVGAQTHQSAANVGINTSANVILFTTGQLNVNDDPNTPGTSYTALGSDGLFSFYQYQQSNAALSGELGLWSSNSNLRKNIGAIAAYKAPAGASPPYILVHN